MNDLLNNEEWFSAIDNWCKANNIDPEKVYSANGWSKEGEPKFQTDVDRPKVIGKADEFKIKLGQPINTSVFEEAEIIN